MSVRVGVCVEDEEEEESINLVTSSGGVSLECLEVETKMIDIASIGGFTVESVAFANTRQSIGDNEEHEGVEEVDDLEQSAAKTTHIIIHGDISSLGGPSMLIEPTSSHCSLSISRSSSIQHLNQPHHRSNALRYQWDASVFDPVLPVRCKSSNGELHKAKFGSGIPLNCNNVHLVKKVDFIKVQLTQRNSF